MPSLRDYRDRITSVKSTRKITSAMKMVAASKLKRAQEAAEAAQPYASAMAGMIARVAAGLKSGTGPALLVGNGQSQKHLMVVVSSDRGLCGGFNGNLVRQVKGEILRLMAEGKQVKIICFGKKARDVLKRDFAAQIIETFHGPTGKEKLGFSWARKVSDVVMNLFARGEIDVCTLVYNHFISVLAQKPTFQQLIPFIIPANENQEAGALPYSFEPDEESLLAEILPKNISMQIFKALLDSAAGEQAARMTAMDNATRNAGDMIKNLSIKYNRARQAYITKELIEIISGAEAV
ncbi:MAG: F0F1 ATP synthase subunit gamma [Alphaproteobacteria bacterium]|nr:F0F1 ATP synthase subunit gamma [Alphaproteobacteria bacterium]